MAIRLEAHKHQGHKAQPMKEKQQMKNKNQIVGPFAFCWECMSLNGLDKQFVIIFQNITTQRELDTFCPDL